MISFTLFSSDSDSTGKRFEATWEQLGQLICLDPPAAREVSKKSLKLWSPALFRGDHRSRESVEAIFALGFDVDETPVPAESYLRTALAGQACMFHTSSSSTPSAPRWRLLLQLSRPVTADEYDRLWALLAANLTCPVGKSAKDPSRGWYTPRVPAEGDFVGVVLPGAPLDVDAALALTPAKAPIVPAPSAVAPAERPAADRRKAMALALGTSWPAKGRHEAQLALAGALRGEGWTAEDAVEFLCDVCRAAGDEDRSKREKTCAHTWGKPEGSALTGWTRLKTFVDPVIVDVARSALARDAEWTEKTIRRLEGRVVELPTAPAERPAFPVEALPSALHSLAKAQAEFTQVPADLPAMLSIGACSASVAGKLDLEVQPRYVEPLNLFVLIGLATGERKSPNFDVYFAPIQEAERRLVEAAKPLIAQKKAKREALERLLRKRQGDYAATKPEDMPLERANCANKPGGVSLDREVAELAARLEQMEIPATPRLLVDDCTVERLASLMAEQHGRLCVASDEASIMSIVAGRYAKDGKASFEVLLKGYSGTEIRIDRQSKDRPPVYVRRPRLTVCLAVQPSVIAGMSRDPV
ncbi:MAG: DUF3987 domain-containing protein, partial [Polyangiales bacterium]